MAFYRIKFIFIISTLFIVSSSCRSRQQAVSPRNRAIEYLNQRDYDHAIPLLEEIVAADDQDQNSKILLASAFTGSVGLNMIDSYDLFISLLFNKEDNASKRDIANQPKDENSSNPSASPSKESVTNKTLFKREILTFLDNLTTSFYFVFTLPYSIGTERDKLFRAISILEKIPDDRPEFFQAKTFSAVISLNLFANYLNDSFTDLRNMTHVSAIDLICSMNAKIFVRDFKVSLKYLEDAADQTILAANSKGKKVSPQLSKIKTKVMNLHDLYVTYENKLTDLELLLTDFKAETCE